MTHLSGLPVVLAAATGCISACVARPAEPAASVEYSCGETTAAFHAPAGTSPKARLVVTKIAPGTGIETLLAEPLEFVTLRSQRGGSSVKLASGQSCADGEILRISVMSDGSIASVENAAVIGRGTRSQLRAARSNTSDTPDPPDETPAPRSADGRGDWSVIDFGAHSILEPGYAQHDSTQSIKAAIAALPPTGGVVRLPPGVFLVSSTIRLSERRSTKLVGSGSGHDGQSTGTILRWAGPVGGTVVHLDGWSQSSVDDIGIDGVDKRAGVGVHVDRGPSGLVSQKNRFSQLYVAGCRTGMLIGTAGQDEGNNDQTTCYDCTFRNNDTGILWQGNQSVHWQFINLQVTHSSVAGLRTGVDNPDGGGFSVFGGAFAWNTIDFDLPRITEPIQILGLRSERSGTFLRSDSAAGDRGRYVLVQGVWQNSSTGPDSIVFRSGNGLDVRDSHFVGAIRIDNKAGPLRGTAMRTLTGTTYAALIREGPTYAYKVLEMASPTAMEDGAVTMLKGDVSADNIEVGVGGAVRLRNASQVARVVTRLEGEVGVHGGGRVRIGPGSSKVLGASADLSGLLVVRNVDSARSAVFLLQADSVALIADPSATFAVAADAADKSCLYVRDSRVVLQNRTRSAATYDLALLGGESR
jgi:hypothetical protein